MRKSFVIQSEAQHLRPLRKSVEEFLKRSGIPEKGRTPILVALGEACTNCIRHAYSGEEGHPIRVTVEDFKDRLVFRIRDYGRKIDLSKVKPPELPPTKPHGVGIHLMKSFMDQVSYDLSHSRGNELVLTKYKGDGHEDSAQERRGKRSTR